MSVVGPIVWGEPRGCKLLVQLYGEWKGVGQGGARWVCPRCGLQFAFDKLIAYIVCEKPPLRFNMDAELAYWSEAPYASEHGLNIREPGHSKTLPRLGVR